MPLARRRRAAWPPWKENRRLALSVAAVALVVGAAVLWGRGDGRADVALAAQAAALFGWFALLMVAVRRPPRARAPRHASGAALLRAGIARRLAFPLLLAPALGAVAVRAVREQPGAAGLGLAGLVALGVVFLVASALRSGRAFRLGEDGLELRLRGRPAALLRWTRIREVRVETWRAHAGLVLLGEEGSPSLGVSAWLDGSAELAAALLQRAPARALDGPGTREALQALAGELGPGRSAPR
ncbi:conserved hypothetical protein [Anaeromyxobacter dehalogenans 2CP-1]|uniref:PH domain-containing protein n=1 Tax=Anaeromyxobacter dehalogenans (strain ATCC BAA-258 / DSM 21875 / 2CP-1) TaxID=455488 RepID=B8J621_ANAD2|nr:hypothetical protein [Anaeromyxobacter dehalogenans]ACL66916.1 conserved hypothetical protein [Anaeromyxobacter dehalogenans 2CP-1]